MLQPTADIFRRSAQASLKISKPSGMVANELGRIFPQSRKRLQFEPSAHLEGLPDKKKKKRASSSLGRTLKVTICRLPVLQPSIPKGKARSALKSGGRVVEVKLTRSMAASQVKAVINRAYSHFSECWDFLDTGQDNVLSVAANQTPDGDAICSRRGCVYIVDKQVH